MKHGEEAAIQLASPPIRAPWNLTKSGSLGLDPSGRHTPCCRGALGRRRLLLMRRAATRVGTHLRRAPTLLYSYRHYPTFLDRIGGGVSGRRLALGFPGLSFLREDFQTPALVSALRTSSELLPDDVPRPVRFVVDSPRDGPSVERSDRLVANRQSWSSCQRRQFQNRACHHGSAERQVPVRHLPSCPVNLNSCSLGVTWFA